jgi:molybdopterin molybdotransferase
VIPVPEALARLFALVRPTGVEEVALTEAAGRVLARPLASGRAQPPWPTSAMDGYALRSAEGRPGARLRLAGTAAAGARFAGHLGPGEAVRILTGAPLPQGADAVVIQEEAAVEGGWLVLGPGARLGHVRPMGGDFGPGATLAAPVALRPAEIALIAAFGHARVPVARRPVVAILQIGDELVAPGAEPGPDQIYASNGAGLHALVSAAGAEPRLLPIAPDDLGALAFALDLAADADLVLMAGGASVGEHDLAAPAARAAGARLDFHKVAIRPGKPLMAGAFPDGRMIVGLPGNPVSALICGVVFVLPVLRAMLGLPAAPAARTRAVLAAPLAANGPREHYLRGRTGPAGVSPLPNQDSSLLSVLAEADCLIVQPPGDSPRGIGETVEILRI